ncbi:MAG: GDP-mannose-dependent alpha-(1-6)-phosphatidylinositol monomannoside mannosyltransferase [Verrucomicrobiota bacterium]|jgi:glycosyltransferase involved in cell wall biosynthesis
MSPPTRHRLAVVVSHPIQYYAPWFRHIASDPALELKVFYLSDHGLTARPDSQFGTAFAWDTDLLSGYDHAFIPNCAARPDVTRFSGLHNPGLRPALRTFAPRAILLFGYAYRPHLDLILRPPAPIIFRGDSHLLGQSSSKHHSASFLIGHWSLVIRHWTFSLGRFLALRLLFSRPAAFLPVGTANAGYFRHYGVSDKKLFFAPHAVDAAHFTATPERLAAAAAQRAALGIPATAPVVLFAGKLILKKRPDLLLAAFIEAAVPGAHLVFSGDGELLPQLRAAASGLPYVHFLPFANQSAMPARYLLGDVFVLPSEGRYETWGLAVNEAMHLARPCIVSDHVGCAADLIRPELGWIFPAGNQTALAVTLRNALTLPRAELAALGHAAAHHVSSYAYPAATAGLKHALASLHS